MARARSVSIRGRLVEVRYASGVRLCLRMCHRLYQFSLAEARDHGFVDRATGTATSQSGSGIVFRFLVRYVLMAVGAYVILTVSPASLNGLLAGLFLPVAAIACEAVYELYAALVRGM